MEKLPCAVTLDRKNQTFSIVNQMHALQRVAGDKKIYSKYPFVIKLSNGKLLAANCMENEPWVKIIVWKRKNGILNDGTEEYKVPLSYANYLFDQDKIYKDLTNNCFGVDNHKVYL